MYENSRADDEKIVPTYVGRSGEMLPTNIILQGSRITFYHV